MKVEIENIKEAVLPLPLRDLLFYPLVQTKKQVVVRQEKNGNETFSATGALGNCRKFLNMTLLN